MNFSTVISRLRDYFVITGELAKAELCNTMLTQLDEEQKYIYSISEAEAKDLIRYFEKEAGYISYETSHGIHQLIDRLNEKVYGPKTFKPVKKKESKEEDTKKINRSN